MINFIFIYLQQGVIILFPLFLLSFLSRLLDSESFQAYVAAFFVVQFISLLVEHDHNTSGLRLLNLSLSTQRIFSHLLRQKTFWLAVTVFCLWILSFMSLMSLETALIAVLVAIPTAYSPQFFFVYHQQNYLNMMIDVVGRIIILVYCVAWSYFSLNFKLFDFLAFQFTVLSILVIGHWYLLYIFARKHASARIEETNKLEKSIKKITRDLFYNRLLTFLIAFLPFFLFGSSAEWIVASDTIVCRFYLSILALLFPLIKFLLPNFLKKVNSQPTRMNRQALMTTLLLLPLITIGIVGFVIFSNSILYLLFNVDIDLNFAQTALFFSIVPIVVSIIIGTSVKLATARETEIRIVIIRAAPIMLIGTTAAVLFEQAFILYFTILIFEACVAIQYLVDFVGDLKRRNEQII